MSGVLLLEHPRPAVLRRNLGRVTTAAVVLAVLAAAFGLRLRILSHGAGLSASDGYDDGVHWAAAAALVHGRLPYRDFLLLQPPGVVLALAPFAALGAIIGDHLAVGIARLVFIGIATASVGLVMLLARPFSRRAAVVAGAVAAVWFPLAYAERSTLLEPLGGFLLLAALLVARRPGRRAAAVGGVLAGLAVVVKIWYVAPLVVIALFLPGRRLPFVGGGAAAATAVALPFFAAAPATMVREVLLDQLGRPRSDVGVVRRLVTIVGDPLAPVRTAGQLQASQVLAGLLGCLVVVTALAAWRRRGARVFIVEAAAGIAVLLAGPSFFLHYAAFVGHWLALVIGIGAAALTDRIRPDVVRLNALALVCTAVVAANLPLDTRTWAAAQPVRPLRAVLAAERGCVVSDDPGLLANTDVLSRDLAAGCPLWPDVTGWTYDRDRSPSGAARVDDAAWQRHLLDYLRSGDLVVLDRPGTGLSPGTRAVLDTWPVVARVRGVVVRRNPWPDAPAPVTSR